MSNAGVQPVSPAGTGSKRHQIKRSITDVTSSGKNHRGQRDAERHHEHRQHRHRKDHHRDGSAVQMANPALSLRRSLDVPRGEATPAAGLDQSRRASTLPKELDGALENREERLQQEREEALFRAEGLRQSLVDLNTFSSVTTRRLDETYYAVLEKMSGLQSTVSALKELAETSRDIYGTFETESQSLETEIVSQLSAVGQFDEQQRTIESLQSRITDGRHKVQALSQRVDAVRERVESWERSDKQWRESTRRRLKLVWTVMVAVTLAVVVPFLGVKYTAKDAALDVPDGVELAPAPNMSTSTAPLQVDEDRMDRTLVWRTAVDDGERLRVFDEL